MTSMRRWIVFAVGAMACAGSAFAQAAAPAGKSVKSSGAGYVAYALAAAAPAAARAPRFGVVMLGGHGDVDEATAFFCEHSGGGLIVVLRASGEDDYNDEFHGKCPANDVTTIVFSSREGAQQVWVAEQLRAAHGIFIAGGDQSNYIKFWKGTPVQAEMNAAIGRGVPIAGISAGLAVLGEFIFTSMIDTITSPQATADPYGKLVTLDRDFLAIPQLRGVITDSHFSARKRMDRTVVFMARILQDGWATTVHGIGIDETTAVLVEKDGRARVVGEGAAFFMSLDHKAERCRAGVPLRVAGVKIFRVKGGSGTVVDLNGWTAVGVKVEEYEIH